MTAAVVVATLGYLPYHLYARSGLVRTVRLRQELSTLRARNATLAAENRQLQREAESLRDDADAIERVARVELGWIKPGEIIVDLSPAAPDPSPGSPSVSAWDRGTTTGPGSAAAARTPRRRP